MRTLTRLSLTILLIGMLWSGTVAAQIPFIGGGPGFPVYDAANHLQNTITAVQAVLIVANQILELTALEGFVVGDGAMGEALAPLTAIVEAGAALGMELGSLQSQIIPLFSLDAAPSTSFEYRMLAAELRLAINTGYLYAMRAQMLIQTALQTVEHIIGIIGQVAEAFGNLTVSQTLGQSQAKLQQLLVEANVRQAAYERAKSLDGAAEGVLMESINRINDELFADYPR